MIIQTGLRTDIPAFYSKWFLNRLKAGYVCVRNPYNPRMVTEYSLSPEVVDLIGFCTKNPEPMLANMDALKMYGQYWFITITPYGRDVEPNVPSLEKSTETFRRLSEIVGVHRIGWRYDPIIIDENYSVEYHIKFFELIAKQLSGYTDVCVISFVDLYKKVLRNFPGIKAVTGKERIAIAKEFVRIGVSLGIKIKGCAEGNDLTKYGVDCSGCMTAETYSCALGCRIKIPKSVSEREKCKCVLSGDIGAYDTCMHLCKYCYANESEQAVRRNFAAHNPDSPFLIGGELPGDVVHKAKQKSWLDLQISFFN